MAQLDFLVGDIQGNTDKIIAAAVEARDRLAGRPDRISRTDRHRLSAGGFVVASRFRRQVEPALQRLCAWRFGVSRPWSVCPLPTPEGLRNAAVILGDGGRRATYYKRWLPNYSVFDEKRYFVPGEDPTVVAVAGVRVGVTICEDVWLPGPVERAPRPARNCW
jgi:NAD+ synthase (glutamine-hydrolysing)